MMSCSFLVRAYARCFAVLALVLVAFTCLLLMAGCSSSSTMGGTSGGGETNSNGVTVHWSNPAAVPVGTVLTAAQLNATASVPGSFTYSPYPGTVLTTAGTTKLTVTFTPYDHALSGASATVDLTVNAPSGISPTVASLSTPQGAPGTPVMLTGSNFGTAQGKVAFGNTSATISSWSANAVTAIAPNISSGTTQVTLTTAAGAASNTSTFNVLTGTAVCGNNGTLDLNSGKYAYQEDEWNSSLPQCATVSDGAFMLTAGAFGLPSSGAPATFPSLFLGCDWGRCTDSAQTGLPVQVSHIASLKTSASVTEVPGTYNVAYNLWFNTAASTGGQPDGGQVMVWLDAQGGAEPFGSRVATVSIGGSSWDVWTGTESSSNVQWKITSYVRNPGATSASSLDLTAFLADAQSRSTLSANVYLIEVQMGFELWAGGVGLGVSNFDVQLTKQ